VHGHCASAFFAPLHRWRRLSFWRRWRTGKAATSPSNGVDLGVRHPASTDFWKFDKNSLARGYIVKTSRKLSA